MSGLKVKRGQRLVGKVASSAAVALLGSSAYAAPTPQPLNLPPSTHWFSDWEVKSNPAPLDFYATPNANNGNVAAVQAQMNASAAAGKPLGIQVYEGSLSNATASALFNTHYTGDKAISYVFADFENGTSSQNVSQTLSLVNQVRSSTWSKNAYVGEFNLVPLKGYGPSVKDGQDPFGRGTPAYTESQYKSAKVNMANTALYPGSPQDRNKSTFDWANANIRTGLFIAPIGRMTAVQQKIDKDYNGHDNAGVNPLSGAGKFLDVSKIDKHKQIPYVARFNNSGNNSLDTNNNPADGYRFVPGAPLPQAGLSGAQTANQMMGRGDFSAQILHYRTRGAYSVMLFEPGVVGYSKAQEQQDVRDGWYGASDPHVAHINNIFAQKDSKNASLTLNPIVDGVKLSDDGKSGFRSEQTGTIWSGEYSKNLKQLDILASNLDTVNHMVKFGKVDAYDVFTLHGTGAHANDVYDAPSDLTPSRNALIEAGFHRLLQFDLVTTRVYNNSNFTGTGHMKTIWLLNANYQVFTNNNRNDQGIPEPTTFGMLAAAGSMAAVCRRSRKNNA
jgi:hypothetical protein